MISIRQAAAQGIDKLRKPEWKSPDDYLKIDIIDGRAGPWVHLYSPENERLSGKDPVDILELDGRDDEVFEPHDRAFSGNASTSPSSAG